jgi:membrane protease YdiL (CAAX protease family)
VFTVLVVALLLQLIGGIVFLVGLTLVHRGTASQWMRTPPVFTAALAVAVSITALVGIAAVVVSPAPWRLRISLPSLRASPTDVVLVLVAAIGISGVSNGLAHRLGIDAHSTLRVFEEATSAASLGYLAVFIILGSIAAIAEELLFRGYAQTRLASRWGPWAGITVAALFFGGLHFDLVQGTFAFFLGILLGWIAVERRSIATGIYAHAANNAVSFTLSWLLAGSGNEPVYSTWVDLLLSAGLFGGSLFLLRRRLARAPVQDEALLPAAAPVPPPAPGADGGATDAPRPPPPRRRRVFAVIGSGCLLLVAIPAILLGALLFVGLSSPERRTMRERGSTFGAQHLGRECLDTAISGGSGVPRDASIELRRVFLRACLQKAHPSASFCQGVPAVTAYGAIRTWTYDRCKARAASSSQTCEAVIGALIIYCGLHQAR